MGHLGTTALIRLCFAQSDSSSHVALRAVPPPRPLARALQGQVMPAQPEATAVCSLAFFPSNSGSGPAPGPSQAEASGCPDCVSTALGVPQLRGSYPLGALELLAFSSSGKWSDRLTETLTGVWGNGEEEVARIRHRASLGKYCLIPLP